MLKVVFADINAFGQVVGNAGETWICFIRVTAKDPFDDQFDVRIIHDRMEVGAEHQFALQSARIFSREAEARS